MNGIPPTSKTPAGNTPNLPTTSGHHYLPIQGQIFQSGFYVSTVGISTIQPHQSYPPAQHPSLYHFDWKKGRTLPEFGFNLIMAGRGTFESKETGPIEILPGMAIFTFPGVWHRYRPDSEMGWTERWMHFDGEVAHALLDEGVISPKRAVIQIFKPVEVAHALDELLVRIQHTPAKNSILISLGAMNVLTLALAEPPPSVPDTADQKERDPLVDLALEYIWSRSHHVLSVEDVVADIGVARRTLERRMLQVRGHGILNEIIDCRFNRAERLLRETVLPIATVVSLAGFGSDENMRSVFLSRTKLAPAHYRNRFGRSRIPSEADSSNL